MIDTTQLFTEALNLSEHPLTNDSEIKKTKYCQALSYIVNNVVDTELKEETSQSSAEADTYKKQISILGNVIQAGIFKKYISQRFNQYLEQFHVSPDACNYKSNSPNTDLEHSLKFCVTFPWRKKMRCWLLCDAALILLDHSLVNKASDMITQQLWNYAKKSFELTSTLLFDCNASTDNVKYANYLIQQYRANESFTNSPTRKYLVTANMSAGKSTLINALIGKPLARTSQEACTGNICYIYNKAFEDSHVSLASPDLNLTASSSELSSYLWQGEISISSFFIGMEQIASPICIIDTPGVNAALYKEHSRIARHAIKDQSYDKLLYIISPTNLGTDAELKHLKWIATNVAKEKVIFVLNKIDDYQAGSDDISESIKDLRNDLLNLGFESPTICPISAYFGFLLKLKLSNQQLTEDENDEYTLLAKKFSRPKYDLSHYYKGLQVTDSDSAEIKLCKQSGLYGLEKIIYGGTV